MSWREEVSAMAHCARALHSRAIEADGLAETSELPRHRDFWRSEAERLRTEASAYMIWAWQTKQWGESRAIEMERAA